MNKTAIEFSFLEKPGTSDAWNGVTHLQQANDWRDQNGRSQRAVNTRAANGNPLQEWARHFLAQEDEIDFSCLVDHQDRESSK